MPSTSIPKRRTIRFTSKAAKRDRVLVSNDVDMRVLAMQWSAEGRVYRGLIWWPRRTYNRMSIGDFVNAFERLAEKDDPSLGGSITCIN